MNKLCKKNALSWFKTTLLIATLIFICASLVNCNGEKSSEKLSMEEIKEKADFLLLYEQAYDSKNIESNNDIPKIAGISHIMTDEENRKLNLYHADGTIEEIPIMLIYTYASLMSMKESELIDILGAEYKSKIESLSPKAIYMILPEHQEFSIDLERFMCSYQLKNRCIQYPINQKELFRKAGVPNMK